MTSAHFSFVSCPSVAPSQRPLTVSQHSCSTSPSFVSDRRSLLCVAIDPFHHRLALTPNLQLNPLGGRRKLKYEWGPVFSALGWECLHLSSSSAPSVASSSSTGRSPHPHSEADAVSSVSSRLLLPKVCHRGVPHHPTVTKPKLVTK